MSDTYRHKIKGKLKGLWLLTRRSPKVRYYYQLKEVTWVEGKLLYGLPFTRQTMRHSHEVYFRCIEDLEIKYGPRYVPNYSKNLSSWNNLYTTRPLRMLTRKFVKKAQYTIHPEEMDTGNINIWKKLSTGYFW